MAFDAGVAERLREFFDDMPGVTEKKMFGGIAFMVNGNMCCGVVQDRLMARVGPARYQAALERPFAQVMDFTGKPLGGFVYVLPEGFAGDEDLRSWVELSLAFVHELPAK